MKILYIIFVLMALAVLVCIQVLSVEMVQRDARKEERRNAHRYGIEVAERRYEQMIKNTEFRIRQRMTISNESDIKW